jgi:hypothetical protein
MTRAERFGMTEEEAKKLDLPALQARFGNPVHDGNSPLHIAWIRGRAEEHLVSLVGEQEAKRVVSKACAKQGLIAENIQHEIAVIERANAYLAEVKARQEVDQKLVDAIIEANTPAPAPKAAAVTQPPAPQSAADKLAAIRGVTRRREMMW